VETEKVLTSPVQGKHLAITLSTDEVVVRRGLT